MHLLQFAAVAVVRRHHDLDGHTLLPRGIHSAHQGVVVVQVGHFITPAIHICLSACPDIRQVHVQPHRAGLEKDELLPGPATRVDVHRVVVVHEAFGQRLLEHIHLLFGRFRRLIDRAEQVLTLLLKALLEILCRLLHLLRHDLLHYLLVFTLMVVFGGVESVFVENLTGSCASTRVDRLDEAGFALAGVVRAINAAVEGSNGVRG